MITYTAINSIGYRRQVSLPYMVALTKGYYFLLEDEEFFIYECDKEKLNLN